MTRYPLTPTGWTVSARSSVGPFATHVTWRRADGGVTEWASRAHRKRTSRLAGHAAGVWWAPWRVSWWIGVLFAFGSTCFFVGPFPGFVELVGSQVDGIVFFVGSIFFTSAAALLWLETINAQQGPVVSKRRFRAVSFEPHRIDWWSSGVQLVGTLFFNVDTFRAMQAGLDAQAYDRLVWTPGRRRVRLLPGLRLPRVRGGLRRLPLDPTPRARVEDRRRQSARLHRLRDLGDRGVLGAVERKRRRPRGRERLHGVRRALLPRRRDSPAARVCRSRTSCGRRVTRFRSRERGRERRPAPCPPLSPTR